jgi:hypothetical protein
MIERLNEVERRLNALMQALQSNEGRLAAVEQSNWQRAGLSFPFPMGEMLAGKIACVAKVTTEVGKATSATRPGEGTLQRYRTIDLTTTPATLGDLTGVDEYCISINLEKKIADNSTVIAVKFFAVWLIVTPDSCASLL